jgi:hypothetical protein
MTFAKPGGEFLGPAQWTLARPSFEAAKASTCPGCGLRLPVHGGPTHAYVGASPACWLLYGQLSTLSWGPRDGPQLERLVADAYGAQHPGRRQVRAVQSVAVHLMGLCLVFEQGTRARQIVRERDGKRARRTIDLHWLEPPRPNGTLTVCGPLDAVGRDEYVASVEAWARDVWAAWTPHHDTVRCWLDGALPRGL